MAAAPRAAVKAPRLMAAAYGSILDRMVAGGLRAAAAAREGEPAAPARRAPAIRHPVSAGAVHVVGAGIAGLSAAVRLVDAGREVIVHEAASVAGGRCRSYLDPTLGVVIDNGNHLLLSGNHEALDYLDRIGARQTLHDPGAAIFDFADLRSGERWRLDLSEGRIPWWLFDRKRRVPGHGAWRISRAARRVREGAGARRSARRCAARARSTSGSGARS